MARSFYRLYLYLVSVVLLIFAAVVAERLIATLLMLTSLRGTYVPAPAHADIVQAILIFVIAWLVAGTLGGVHYWLIRRDMKADPDAGRGPIRAFFLNFVEGIAALIAVSTITATVSQLGQPYPGDYTGLLATAIVALGLVVVLELERRRARAGTPAALVFQRLHLYATQFLILLFIAAPTWLQAAGDILQRVLLNADRITLPCPTCLPPNPVGPTVAALLTALAWGAYVLLARDEGRSLLRQIFRLGGFFMGLMFLLYAASRGIELALRAAFNLPFVWDRLLDTYNFIPPLVFGGVVLTAYVLLLRAEVVRSHAEALGLTAETVAAIVLGAWFWVGCGLALHELVEQFVGTTPPLPADWAAALGVLVTGLAYLAVAPHLGLRSRRLGITGPHRAYVYVMLAAGTLTTAIAGVITLYAVGTNLLGAPLDNWQQIARIAGEALAVGVVILALHLVAGSRHRYLRAPKPVAPVSLPV